MQKTAVSSARSGAFSLKKRRFLKLLRIFVSIKNVYLAYYQRFSCNAQNKRFSQLNDNPPANIGCMCGQNSIFVNFIHQNPEVHKKTKETWLRDVADAKPALQICHF